MCDNQTNRRNNNLMKTYMTSIKAIAVVAGMLPALAGVAGITNTTNTYSFAEFGWSGGGVVDGSFTAVFPENATNITQTEVTAFSVTFTGNTNGDDFSIPLSGLGAMNFAINGSYNVTSGIDSVLPVSAYIPGCPASPNAIIDGVVKLLTSLEAKEEVAAVKPQISGELGPQET